MSAFFGGAKFIEHVGVVVEPASAAGGDEEKHGRGRDDAGQAQAGAAGARFPGEVAAAPVEENGENAEKAGDGEPIGEDPGEGGDEVPIAIHVGVGIGGDFAEENETVFNADAVEDGNQDEESDHDAVADELVGDDGLHEEGHQRVDEDLGEGDEVELLEVLEELEVEVSLDGLGEDAADHDDRKQDELDDGKRAEFAGPVDAFAQGQGIVNLLEADVALAPDELAGIHGGDDDEEQHRRTLHRLQHEEGYGPDVAVVEPAGEVAIDESIDEHDEGDGPERDLADNVANAQAHEAGELLKGGGSAEGLVHGGQLDAEACASWADILLLDFLLLF